MDLVAVLQHRGETLALHSVLAQKGPMRFAYPRPLLRILLAAFYGLAGIMHLLKPEPFLTITPAWVPLPPVVVALTGIAELAGAAALLQPWSVPLRRAGGIGLALYALCVWPANVNHMLIDLARSDHGGLPLAYHLPRLAAQPLLIWLALLAGGVNGRSANS